MSSIKVLIVEDELLIADDLAMKLKKMGFEVTGQIDNGEAVLDHVRENFPDIILMDIKLAGEKDGIAVAEELSKEFETPILFLTDQTDHATFHRALETNPAQFMTKPFNIDDLYRSINLAFKNSSQTENGHNTTDVNSDVSLMNGVFFIKTKGQIFEKVEVENMVYLEADRSYSTLFTEHQKIEFSCPLNSIFNQLNHPSLQRVSRSHVVNINKIVKMDGNTLYLKIGTGTVEVLVKKTFKEEFLKKLPFVK